MEKYYLSIDHTRLLGLLQRYTDLSCTEKEKDLWSTVYKTEIEQFLSLSFYKNKALPIASGLGRALSQIYLLPLVALIKRHNIDFLYFSDDFLFFFTTQKKCDQFYWSHLLPLLEKHTLQINIEKTCFGTTKDRVSFLGYEYRSGSFSIEKSRQNQLYTSIKQLI